MKRGRQSKNVEDERPGSTQKLDRVVSARNAVNETLRNMYGNQGATSVQQRANAKALGMQDQTIELQNQANKVQARLRRRNP